MAVGIYGTISGASRKNTKTYGTVNSLTKSIKAVYGVVGGVTKPCTKNVEETIYTTSQTVAIPSGCKSIDVFAVGGGGGAGGGAKIIYNPPSGESRWYYQDAPSGGAGYTNTQLGISATNLTNIQIVIGAGGTAGTGYTYENYGTGVSRSGSNPPTAGGYGGTTYVYLKNGSSTVQTIQASGGARVALSSTALGEGSSTPTASTNMMYYAGTTGGTGTNPSGSCGQRYSSSVNRTYEFLDANDSEPSGFSAPSPGYGSSYSVTKWHQYDNNSGRNTTSSVDAKAGGSGQNKTTKAFEEASGTVYAKAETSSVTANSGNGGYGYKGWGNTGYGKNSAGASGVVIVRYHF